MRSSVSGSLPAGTAIWRSARLVHVADVARSIVSYELLGVELKDTNEHDRRLDWAALESRDAQLVLARASAPIERDKQAVLFYLYAGRNGSAGRSATTSTSRRRISRGPPPEGRGTLATSPRSPTESTTEGLPAPVEV